jgi:hypothetical protein
MTTSVHTSKSGRTIIESDGYSESYRAYISGAQTGKVSIPASVCVDCPEEAFHAALWGDIPGAIVLARGEVF